MEFVKIAYLGNFGVDFSTETHVAKSLYSLGHEVLCLQEGETRAADVPEYVVANGCEMLLWTQTYGLAVTGGTADDRFMMLDLLRDAHIPTVGFHLDKWWGLARQPQLNEEAFFSVDYLFTADGGHDEGFKDLGINHVWAPPAVFHEECEPGQWRQRWASEIAFVGNWRGGYHEEATHRAELISHLRTGWRKRCRFHPRGPAVRGKDLRDLYASTRVVVGDSCLLPGDTHYCSDRVFETVGRGGFLLHPHVDGIFPDLLEDGKHLRTWTLGDWDELDHLIHYYLEHESERREIAARGMEFVRANHTYRNRLERVLETVFPDASYAGQVHVEASA